jgi:dTDP-4-dehydrorhamnose reductase
MWAVNATGAQHVAVAAQAVGARLIHISTDVIFNGETETPYTEADPPDPITPYGASKAEAERLVLEAHPKALLVRTSLIYGFTPVDRHTQFILDIAEGRSSARLFRDEYRCPVFVGDLAGALLELAANTCQGVSNVINVAGEESLSRHEFGQRLAAHYGHDPSRLPSGLSSETPGRRPRNCLLDIRPAQRILHTPLRGVTQVLAEQSNNP